MWIRLLRLAVVLLLFAWATTFAQRRDISERKEILARCAQYFGPTIDAQKNLFEANTFYVLAVTFDGKGKLTALAIRPKHLYEDEHPDWKEPDNFEYLSWIQYQNLATRLDLIRPKGKLIKPATPYSVVTNMTAWQTSIHENARLTLGVVVDLREPEDTPAKLKWIKVEYGESKTTEVAPDLGDFDKILKEGRQKPN